MKHIAISTVVLLGALLAAYPVLAEHSHPHPGTGAQTASPAVTELAPGVGLLIGQDGNVVMVSGPRGVLIVDDQRPRSVPAVVAAANGPITHVINTHWHLDHSGGNAILGEGGAEVIAHRNVRARLMVDQFMAAYNRTVAASPAIAWPTIVFDDRLTIHHGEETIRLLHTPAAHTDGDTLVYLERADVLHMGDLYFNGLFPFIDRSSGGTIDGLIAAIDVALGMAGERTHVIPAHGAPAMRADLVAWREMLATVRERVAREKDAGRSLERMNAADLTAGYTLGGDADRFVSAIYDSLPPSASTTRP